MATVVIDGLEWTAEELEVRSRHPSPMLMAMRDVMLGRVADREEMKLLHEIRQKNPRQFLQMVRESEKDYADHMAKLIVKPEKSDPVSHLGPDEREGKLDDLTESLLGEWSDG